MIRTTFVGGVNPFQPEPKPFVAAPREPRVPFRTYYSKDDVLEYIIAKPGCTCYQLAFILNRKKDVVHRHLLGLLKDKKLRRERAPVERGVSPRNAPYLHWAAQCST